MSMVACEPQARDLFDESESEILFKLLYTDYYKLNFREVFWWRIDSSTPSSGFKLRFSATSTKDFRIFSCCLMIGIAEIPEYLVLNPNQFGCPQMLGAPAIWSECPL